MTHYLPAFTEMARRSGLKRAVCGAWILSADHGIEPECVRCQTWLRATSLEAAALEILWANERQAAPHLHDVNRTTTCWCGARPGYPHAI